MNSTIFKAILAMDSYNRGYDAGIKFGNLSGNNSDDSSVVRIGNATIYDRKGDIAAQAIGFYGIAYQLSNGEKVISYRGTDAIALDALTGFPVGSGNPRASQAIMAFDFYNAVAGGADPRTANISLTGHSLGGGLAGLVGANNNYCAIKSKVVVKTA